LLVMRKKQPIKLNISLGRILSFCPFVIALQTNIQNNKPKGKND